MDRKKSLLNVGVSIGFKVILLIGNIIVRRFLIQCIGNEVNGLNSLYLSIIGFLSVAELGVGTAITFSMYKPIVEGDVNKVSALYGVFTRLYTVIGFVILIAGCFTMPFLRFLAKDYADLQVNIYITFFLMLISVVLTYFYNSKLSLINAYKNNYISTTITSCGQILQYVLQVIVLVVTESYVWYLVCRIVAVVVQWGITEIVSNRKYKMIICNKQVIDKATKNEIVKNIKAMFMHKIGDVLVNTVDSIVISAFLGVVILGKYSNYTTIVMAMAGVITLFSSRLLQLLGIYMWKRTKLR